MDQIGKFMNTRANVTFTRTNGNLNTTNVGETKGTAKAANINTNWFEKSIDRKDLDNISPYAGMGLNISQKAPVGSVESYKEAAPELGKWQGNYTIENKQEALDYLTAYNTALKTYSKVAPHIQQPDSPFADVFTA